MTDKKLYANPGWEGGGSAWEGEVREGEAAEVANT